MDVRRQDHWLWALTKKLKKCRFKVFYVVKKQGKAAMP
jgi:hypothetical protein